MTLAPGNDVLNQAIGTNAEGQTTWLLGQNEGGGVVRFSANQIVVAGIEAIPLAGSLVFNNGTLEDGFTAPSAGVVVSNGTSLAAATLSNLGFSGGTLSLSGANVIAALTYTPLSAASNLSDLGSASTARTNLGLGGAAVLNVGTATSTVAAGNDSRITGALQAASNLSDVASAGVARKNINQGEVTLSASAASIATDCSLGNVFKATLVSGTGPYTLANPTNMVAGATYIWRFTQPSGGSAQTLTYGSAFRFATPYSNASPPALTATLSAVDYVTGICDGTHIDCQLANTFA